MTTISKFTNGGPAVIFAHVHITKEQASELEFEILEANAGGLREQVGVRHLLAYNGKDPFWAELVSLEPCVSTAVGLGLLRDRPTLRGKLKLLAVDTSQLQ